MRKVCLNLISWEINNDHFMLHCLASPLAKLYEICVGDRYALKESLTWLVSKMSSPTGVSKCVIVS